MLLPVRLPKMLSMNKLAINGKNNQGSPYQEGHHFVYSGYLATLNLVVVRRVLRSVSSSKVHDVNKPVNVENQHSTCVAWPRDSPYRLEMFEITRGWLHAQDKLCPE